MEVRVARAGEGSLLRELRLRALADAPAAFGATYDQELAYPDTVWQERAAAVPGRATFIAEEQGSWFGVAVGIGGAAPADQPTAALVSMWVDPTVRRRGVGRTLVEAVVAWARSRGARRIALDVVEGNGPAIALYAAAGFTLAGAAQGRALRPDVRTVTMVREL